MIFSFSIRITEFRIGDPPKPSIRVPPTRALIFWADEWKEMRRSKTVRNLVDFISLVEIRTKKIQKKPSEILTAL
jgi:hypothetical protein